MQALRDEGQLSSFTNAGQSTVQASVSSNKATTRQTSSAETATPGGVLRDRLEELNILEIQRDGLQISNLKLTLRGLYKHVLSSITATSRQRTRMSPSE